MSGRRERAADWQAVAGIRALQRRAAEMAAMRAGAGRAAAAARRDECEAALERAQQGWSDSLEGAFDPALARGWFAKVDSGRAEAGAAAAALAEAENRLGESRAAFHAAQVRADVAERCGRTARSRDARRRDEAGLAEVEDRAARQARRP